MPQIYDPKYNQVRRRTSDRFTIVLLAALFIGIAVIPMIFGVDAEGATRTLQANGFKDIKITGYKWFNGTEDFYNTGFEATGPNGMRMSGNVSRGLLFKGATIRFD